MHAGLRDAVRKRARLHCEYCRLPERFAPITPFQVEHIVSRQHGGPTLLSNLALACDRCNLHKGPNLTGIDPITRRLVRLFNPRRHRWSRHFRWDGAILHGLTAIGRTTISVLDMNAEDRIELRRSLADEGVEFPS